MSQRREHIYQPVVTWQGNFGQGTKNYKGYGRNHSISSPEKNELLVSSDPAFRGDPKLYNPEDLFVASLSGCHMLWYLHLCAEEGVVVESYVDRPLGVMVEGGGAPGSFASVTLRPEVKISAGDIDLAISLHQKAHAECFIANSVKTKIVLEPKIEHFL